MSNPDPYVEEIALDLMTLGERSAVEAVRQAREQWQILQARKHAIRVAMGLEEADYDHYGV